MARSERDEQLNHLNTLTSRLTHERLLVRSIRAHLRLILLSLGAIGSGSCNCEANAGLGQLVLVLQSLRTTYQPAASRERK